MSSSNLPVSPPLASRLLGAADFRRLVEVPAEIEWFANLENQQTRRAYQNALQDFMKFVGIVRPDEFSGNHPLSCHRLARRLKVPGIERHDYPPSTGGAVIVIRVFV